MSNMPSSPGSRPLEQLKVAELRDELKKRGMSIKGVKKELFERLEEAIKKEENEGIVHGEHGAAQDGAAQEGELRTGAPDESEDSEGQDDILDGTKDEVSKSHDALDACRSDTLPNVPILINNESTPLLETQALSGVSAPDGVPGFNEDREPLSTAGMANVETNNDVLFVDNAVCGNGDAVVLPEKVPDVIDELESGKEASGSVNTVSDLGHVQSKDQETEPDFTNDGLVSDLAVGEAVGTACTVGENIMSDVPNMPTENGDPGVAVDNAMTVNDASGNHCRMDVVDTTEVENLSLKIENEPLMQPVSQLLDPGGPLEVSQDVKEVIGLKTESLSVSSCLVQSVASQDVHEPSADLRSEKLEGLNVDERYMVTKEEKCNVGEQDMTVNEENRDVKMEPMETDTGPEEHEAIREGGRELPIDKEVHPQPESPCKEAQLKEVESKKSTHDHALESRAEGSASRVPDDPRKDTMDDVDLKLVEDDSQTQVNLKRKDDDTKQQEPAKRMRRWNSGNQVAVDAVKPLTTDTVKEIMPPESTAAQKLTPRAMATSRSLPPKVKAESDSSGISRTVPPSTRAPSDSLKIERFVRPFTLKAVKDLLAEFGQCVDFWMDQIKTHCFVTYSSVNEAVAARSALYGRQWPPSVGNFLIAEFVDVKEVKIRSEGLSEKAQATPTTVPLRVATAPPSPSPRIAQSASSFRSDSNAIPPSRFSREGPPPPAPKKDPETTVLTLEDLFCKTKAKPHIYYLPLTDEQVAEKNKNKQAIR